jgi:hypothetical protein
MKSKYIIKNKSIKELIKNSNAERLRDLEREPEREGVFERERDLERECDFVRESERVGERDRDRVRESERERDLPERERERTSYNRILRPFSFSPSNLRIAYRISSYRLNSIIPQRSPRV